MREIRVVENPNEEEIKKAMALIDSPDYIMSDRYAIDECEEMIFINHGFRVPFDEVDCIRIIDVYGSSIAAVKYSLTFNGKSVMMFDRDTIRMSRMTPVHPDEIQMFVKYKSTVIAYH